MKKLSFLCLLCSLAVTGCSDVIDPDGPEELLDQAYHAANNARWEIALQYAAEAYKRRTDDSSVRIMYALSLENNGRENDALEIGRAAAEDKTSFMAQYTYGRMLFQRQKYNQAYPVLKTALELKNDDFNTLLLLQQTAAILKSAENQDYYTRLWRLYGQKRGKDFSAYIYNEGALYFLQANRRNPNVEKGFLRALNATPDAPELHLNLAIYYDFFRNNYAKAEPYYKKFMELTAHNSGMEKERNEVRQREIQRQRR